MSVNNIYGAAINDGLYYSTNFGDSFLKGTVSGGDELQWQQVVSASDGKHLAAVANDSNVYLSTDYGATWSVVQIDAELQFISIAISSDGSKMSAISSNTTIYQSINSGLTWNLKQTLNDNGGNQCSIVSSFDGNIVVVLFTYNQYQYLYKSTSGNVFEQLLSYQSYLTQFQCVAISSDGNVIAVGTSYNKLITSINYGISFSVQENSPSIVWQSIAMSSTGEKMVAVNSSYGYIYTSIDTGVNWTQHYQQKYWNSVASSLDGFKLVACDNTSIYTSTDSGASWNVSNSPSLSWSSVALSQSPAICFEANTQILINNHTYKSIKDIKRGDIVITDIPTNSTNTVSKIVQNHLIGQFVKIPKNLLANSHDIICTKTHPIWIGNSRVLAKNIKGVQFINMCGYFYNIQFDCEDTFYVDDIKVDSLSPNHHRYKLEKELYWDETLYDNEKMVYSEYEASRNKPKLIEYFEPTFVFGKKHCEIDIV